MLRRSDASPELVILLTHPHGASEAHKCNKVSCEAFLQLRFMSMPSTGAAMHTFLTSFYHSLLRKVTRRTGSKAKSSSAASSSAALLR